MRKSSIFAKPLFTKKDQKKSNYCLFQAVLSVFDSKNEQNHVFWGDEKACFLEAFTFSYQNSENRHDEFS